MTNETIQEAGSAGKSFLKAGVAEAATFFDVTPRTIRNWVAQRKIPHFKIAGILRFDLEVLEKHVREKCLIKPKT